MDPQIYIDLLKKVLIDYHRRGSEYKPLYANDPSWKKKMLMLLDAAVRSITKGRFTIVERVDFKKENREGGRDWPANAESMIGLKRMENIEFCVKSIIADKIPGDLIETGVWRGGATIFMRALLKVNDVGDRVVWVADSFEGLPKPDEDKYAADKGDKHHTKEELAVGVEIVKANFEKYGLLDDQVKFLVGWFKDTLPTAPIKKLALIRLDGDMYESTMDALVSLYPKLSPGGYLIIDDYFLKGCKQAIVDYRKEHNITEEIIDIDGMGAYWRKKA